MLGYAGRRSPFTFTQAIALTFEKSDIGVVGEAIQQGGDGSSIGVDSIPFFKCFVGASAGAIRRNARATQNQRTFRLERCLCLARPARGQCADGHAYPGGLAADIQNRQQRRRDI